MGICRIVLRLFSQKNVGKRNMSTTNLFVWDHIRLWSLGRHHGGLIRRCLVRAGGRDGDAILRSCQRLCCATMALSKARLTNVLKLAGAWMTDWGASSESDRKRAGSDVCSFDGYGVLDDCAFYRQTGKHTCG